MTLGLIYAMFFLAAFVPAFAITPANLQVLDNGTAVDGPCSLVSNQVNDESKAWIAYTVDPARIQAPSEGHIDLVRSAAYLPDLEVFQLEPNTLRSPVAEASAMGDGTGGCQVTAPLIFDTVVSGTQAQLKRPGPYVFKQLDFQVGFTLVPMYGTAPTPIVCGNNSSYYPGPQVNLNGPADPPDGIYLPSNYCNTSTYTMFYVKGDNGSCPVVADMSQWPSVPYISQYDTGARLPLPMGMGRLGGNACGPSSLMMAMLRSTQNANTSANQPGASLYLPDMLTTFDATMGLTSAQVQPNQPNAFYIGKAETFARSLGWRSARVVYLGSDQTAIAGGNLSKIINAPFKGLIVISTAFGSSQWGVTGGGHIIMIDRFDATANGFVVNDPAGNYFGTPQSGYSDTQHGHYGPKACGYGVTYPASWLVAMTTGRRLLDLGNRTLPVAAPTAGLTPQSAAANAISAIPSAAGSFTFGAAVSAYDTVPEGPDAPASFYFEDPEGRRAGWIDGNIVEEIPDAAVTQDLAEWTDPAIGDPDIPDSTPLSPPPPRPRQAVISNPETGTMLHIVGGSSGAYALTVEAWGDGQQVAKDELTGSAGPGEPVVVDSAALDAIATSAASGSVNVYPAAIHFGDVVLGKRVTKQVSVTNLGTSGVTVSNVGAPTDSAYRLVHNGCKNQTLTPGKSCILAVRLTAADRSSPNLIVLTLNGQTNATLALTGRGISKGTQPGALALNPIYPDTVGLRDPITLTGTNFTSLPGGKLVIGGKRAKVIYWDDQLIEAVTPNLKATAQPTDVTIIRKGERAGNVAAQGSLTISAPDVSSGGLSPNTGKRGDPLSVTGQYFGESKPKVIFTCGRNNHAGRVKPGFSDTALDIIVPPGTGTCSVTISNFAGASGGLPFTYP